MEDIVVSIPEELQIEIDRLKQEKDIDMSYAELYQYLIRVGLGTVCKSEPQE